MQSTERLISSDDHVDVSHDQVKSNLASKYHANYDRAVEQFQSSMKQMRSGQLRASGSGLFDDGMSAIDVRSRVFLDEWSFSGGVGVRLRWLPE